MAAPKTSKPAAGSAPAANAPVALIYGDDDFAVNQRARQIYQQWCAELGGMDHEIIDAQINNGGEAIRALGKLREALNTLPFFGGGKAIWFRGCNFFKVDRTSSSTLVSEAVAELAQDLKVFPWQNIRLLVTAPEINRTKAIYKTLEKLGTVEACAAWKLEDNDWAGLAEADALRALRARKKDITDAALAELIQSVGPHRQQLASEVEKLSLYIGDRPAIDVPDVIAIVTRNKQARAFAVAEALGDRDLPRLIRTLEDELWETRHNRDKSEIGLLYGIISKVRALVLMKEALREGWLKAEPEYYRFKQQFEQMPESELPSDRRYNPRALHPFVAHKAVLQCRNYTSEELVSAMGLLLECNQRLVTSGLDEALILQQTLVNILRGAADQFPAAPKATATRPAPWAGRSAR